MENLFDLNLVESELIDILSKMEFKKIGEGYAAHVFSDTEQNIVLKFFPPLSAGGPEELNFIEKNYFLKYADMLTVKWQNHQMIKWIRQKAKSFVALSHSSKNIENKMNACETYIKAYELSVKTGLMKRLPTRVISNCLSQLSLNINQKILNYMLKPNKIVLQERFKDEDVVLNVIKSLVQKGDILSSKKLIEGAVNFQVDLWRQGLTNTDMSFNMLDSLLLLPDGKLQIHDANGINCSIKHSRWYIREKEKDIGLIFREIKEIGYPQSLYATNRKGISGTARKLHTFLPKQYRDDLVMSFLTFSLEVLSENVMMANWKNS